MTDRDAFGFERDGYGFDELLELQTARHHPPSFCWTPDEYRSYLKGDVSEAELRLRHQHALGDARSEWAEYGWLPGRGHTRLPVADETEGRP